MDPSVAMRGKSRIIGTPVPRASTRCHHLDVDFFFFKQKTAYEIGLGIPAEPLFRSSLGTVRHPRRFKIVVIDIQITLKQMLRDFIGIRVNRAKKSGMVNITSSVNSRERSGINTILHELNPLFTINVTMR